MTLKVVLDTNILVSATIAKGPPDQVLKLARKDKIKLLTSQNILDEFARVLKENLDYPPQRIKEEISFIKNISTVVKPKQKIDLIKEDEPDNRILECAVEGKAQYIVSGDTRHLQPLKEYKGIKILSPTEFLKVQFNEK